MVLKRKGKRTQRKRKGGRKGIRPNKSALGLNPAVHNRNYAMITETLKPQTVGGQPPYPLVANQAYITTTSIASFPRALAVARCFKFYRLKSVVYDYVPDANTYQAGGTNTETVPYMYYMMNRDGSDQSSINLLKMQNAGARPIKFTKKIVIAYKPNLIKANQLIVSLGPAGAPATSLYNGNNTPVYDEWISTMGLQHGGPNNWAGDSADIPTAAQGNTANPLVLPDNVNVLPYYGHSVFFQQQVVPDGASAVGYLSMTCIWEFKEPVLYDIGSS